MDAVDQGIAAGAAAGRAGVSPFGRGALGIIGRALLWLPLCLAGWYAAAGFFSWVPGHLAAPALRAMVGEVRTVAVYGRKVAYTVVVEAPYRVGGAAPVEAEIEVHAATYTFGIALFIALALAARESRQVPRIALGCALLALLPAWGIAFDAMRQVGAAAAIAPLLRWGGATREAIALGYQVGALLLPTLAPIAFWLALFPRAWQDSARPPPRAVRETR